MKLENNEENMSVFSKLPFSNKGIKLLKAKKERNSSFELLRIFLIFLIVLHHIFINFVCSLVYRIN